MTAPAHPGPAAPAWYHDAERLGPALDRAAAVLVVGRDGEAAAWAALGAARAQATRRRVAVADLVGDAGAFAGLVDPDDPIGVSDSFFYGVSLNRIARAADASGDLYVLPSGSEPVAVEGVLASDRWRRLAAGFRDAGALLLLAARADAPGLDVLAAAVDGLVVVGDLAGLLPDAPPPLMVIPGPSVRRGRRPAERGVAAAAGPDARPTPADDVPAQHQPGRIDPGAPSADARDAVPPDAAAWAARQQADTAPLPGDAGQPPPARPAVPRVAEADAVTPSAPARARRLVPAALGAAAVAAGVWWAVTQHPTPAPRAPRAAAAAAAVPAPPPRDSAPARADSAPVAPGALAVANPADSAQAAAYAVFLVSANTPEGATLEGVDQATLPILSLTPVLDGGAPWWRLLAGAYPTRARADSLLADLQRRGVLGASSGLVVRAPYALLVADRLPAAEAPARVEALARRGVPTYPLSRGDGTVALYGGAFERPADAEYLATALQAAGVRPVLVFRTGGSL